MRRVSEERCPAPLSQSPRVTPSRLPGRITLPRWMLSSSSQRNPARHKAAALRGSAAGGRTPPGAAKSGLPRPAVPPLRGAARWRGGAAAPAGHLCPPAPPAAARRGCSAPPLRASPRLSALLLQTFLALSRPPPLLPGGRALTPGGGQCPGGAPGSFSLGFFFNCFFLLFPPHPLREGWGGEGAIKREGTCVTQSPLQPVLAEAGG